MIKRYKAEELAKHAKVASEMKVTKEFDKDNEIVIKAKETDTVTTNRLTIFFQFRRWIGKRLRTATVCCCDPRRV